MRSLRASRLRHLVVPLGLGLLLAAGCASNPANSKGPPPPLSGPDLTSGLTIPAREVFLLGGGQPDPFFAEIYNRGAVPVSVASEVNGRETPIGVVQPGETVSHRFAAQEGAWLRNSAQQDAALRVRVWGNPNALGMRYQPVEP